MSSSPQELPTLHEHYGLATAGVVATVLEHLG